MKKSLLALAVLACLCSCADNGATITNTEDSKYCIAYGDAAMTVDAAFGGRILSFTLGSREVISQFKMPNAFGSTFWTSPQKEWNWPPVKEYDSLPYEASVEGGSLLLKGGVSRFGYSVGKKFSVDPKDGAFVVEYTIYNESGEVRSVAPWEITRVPSDGEVFFDAPVSGITPEGLMDFKEECGLSWYSFDEAEQNRKVNADGKGWLAYANGGLLLVKKFPDLAPSEPAPGEAEVQVYVNRGHNYTELESQGAYVELKDGESVSYTVRWYLLPVEESASREALAAKVKEI